MGKKQYRSGEHRLPEGKLDDGLMPEGSGTPVVPATRSTLVDQLTALAKLLEQAAIEHEDFAQLDRLLQEGTLHSGEGRRPLEVQAEIARLTGKYGYIAGKFPTAAPVYLATLRRGRGVGSFLRSGRKTAALSKADWAALIEQLEALKPARVADVAPSFDQKLDVAGKLMQLGDVPDEGIRRLRKAMRASTPSHQRPLDITIFEVATYCGYLVDYGPCHYGRPALISKIKNHQQAPVSEWGSAVEMETPPVVEYPLESKLKIDLKAAILKAFPNLSEEEASDYIAEGHRRDDAARRYRAYLQSSQAQPDTPILYKERAPGMRLVEFLRKEYLAKGVLAQPGFTRRMIKETDKPLYDAIKAFCKDNDLPEDVDIPKARQRLGRREAARLKTRRSKPPSVR